MRAVVFLKNNPVIQDALNESSPPVDRPEVTMYVIKEKMKETFFLALSF